MPSFAPGEKRGMKKKSRTRKETRGSLDAASVEIEEAASFVI